MENRIQIMDAQGQCKAEKAAPEQVVLTWEGEYTPGDVILFEVSAPGHYVLRVDDCMDEATVYITGTTLRYPVLFEEKKNAHNPKAFTGVRHYLSLRPAQSWELGYRNLARNPADQHDVAGCYPHASANVETRGEAVFAARNAIDGMWENASHGEWPYQSWGINRDPNAALTVDFGREVLLDELRITERADFPHDNYWVRATVEFSDGSRMEIPLQKTNKPQRIPMEPRRVRSLVLKELISADGPSPFPALTQIEAWGVEADGQ